VLVKRMMPVAPCFGGSCDLVYPLRGLAGFSDAIVDMCPPHPLHLELVGIFDQVRSAISKRALQD